MVEYRVIFIYLLGFIWILFAANYFSNYLKRVKLPLITGFLLTGVLCGPNVLNLLRAEAVDNLSFVNDFSLAYIAMAAGAELYLKELRTRVRSIAWNTFGQLVVTFVIGSIAVYFLAGIIPFMRDMSEAARVGVAILMATIFVARSPSSAIAVINELRAKGPFTQITMGVTVLKDVFVILLFAICFSISATLIHNLPFDLISVAFILFELGMAIGLGYALYKLLEIVLSFSSGTVFKTLTILVLGYLVFVLSHYVRDISHEHLGHDLHFEPLLICIVASFLVTNFSKFRPEFQFIINRTGPYIYVAFFTYTGATMSLDVLSRVWFIALILFVVRLVSIMIGAYIGSTIAEDNKAYRSINWMPYVTQAGVGLGLATEVAAEYPAWGNEFATIVIGLIVINQFVGPPLFKWAIVKARESHVRADTSDFDSVRIATIFGYEAQSLALARQLQKHGWVARIATLKPKEEVEEAPDVDFEFIKDFSLRTLKEIGVNRSEAIILLLSDQENLRICSRVYENIGTKGMVVRLNDRSYQNEFHELGALIVDPDTAIVSLMDNFVRSPVAASLLLGIEEDQSTIDIQIMDRALHGMTLRNLRLPSDVIILSVKRRGQTIISHGYTRLRRGDVVTVVGSEDSLNTVRLLFEGR
jgi:Trk K+ transport system NAD-binding subunit/Kef-type K+ transport system membrane component KefB